LADDVKLDVLAKETEGFSGADIAAVCSEAKLIAIRNFVSEHAEELEAGANLQKEIKACKVTQTHLLEALKQAKPTEERAIAVGKEISKEKVKKDMGFV
ncbi:MAG: hypothetical protein ACTSSG_08455, partial [Candidatus Heimdallarchaeaceae archaeon]